MQKHYYVYILSNYKRTTLYIGVTSNLKRRIEEHSMGMQMGFTKKYKLKYLMYYEEFGDVLDALYREKSLKGKNRKKKEDIINSINPDWKDLSPNIF